DQHPAEGIDGAAPEVFAPIPPLDVLAEMELQGRRVPRLVGQAHQHPGQGQAGESGVLRLPGAPPLYVVDLLENPGQVQWPLQLVEAVQAEERGMDPGNERRERRGRDPGDLGERLQVVVWMVWARAEVDVIIAQQDAQGLPARVAEFGLVDLAEELAL